MTLITLRKWGLRMGTNFSRVGQLQVAELGLDLIPESPHPGSLPSRQLWVLARADRWSLG